MKSGLAYQFSVCLLSAPEEECWHFRSREIGRERFGELAPGEFGPYLDPQCSVRNPHESLINQQTSRNIDVIWSERRDSNPRPLVPQNRVLSVYVTERHYLFWLKGAGMGRSVGNRCDVGWPVDFEVGVASLCTGGTSRAD